MIQEFMHNRRLGSQRSVARVLLVDIMNELCFAKNEVLTLTKDTRKVNTIIATISPVQKLLHIHCRQRL
jgi:hypothetical protein